MNSPHYMTPAEIERLVLLAEEAAEVQQIIMKILRHGKQSFHPDDSERTSNIMLLQKEIGDFQYVLDLMAHNRDISADGIQEFKKQKSRSVGRYLHHNEAIIL